MSKDTSTKQTQTDLTEKQATKFHELLVNFGKTATQLRKDLQELIVLASMSYQLSGSPTRLNMLMKIALKSNAIRTKTLAGYLLAHVHVKWSKDRNDKPCFILKRGFKSYDVDMKAIVSSKWYEFGKSASDELKPLDAKGALNALLNRINKVENGEVKRDFKDPEEAKAVKDLILKFQA